jgi:hypothetical protein
LEASAPSSMTRKSNDTTDQSPKRLRLLSTSEGMQHFNRQSHYNSSQYGPVSLILHISHREQLPHITSVYIIFLIRLNDEKLSFKITSKLKGWGQHRGNKYENHSDIWEIKRFGNEKYRNGVSSKLKPVSIALLKNIIQLHFVWGSFT